MKNNLINKIICISVILIALLGSIHFCCYDEDFYHKQHSKIKLYGESISEYIGISDDELDELTHFTLDYLNNPEATLDLKMNIKGEIREVFTEDEKSHMVDVKKLNLASVYVLQTSIVVFVISLFIFIIKKLSLNELYVQYKNSLLKTLLIFIVIGIWVLIDFDSFWTLFHRIFFMGNDLWLLNLRKDILIMIVPPEFFYNLVTRIVLIFLSVIIALYIVLFILKRRFSND